MTQKCGSSVIKQPLLLHANSALFSFKVGQDRENKVIVADLIHIGYWRWSLQLLSSSVRLSLWTQTSKSIAYRVRSASLNSRSLLHSLGRVPLCAALPLLLTCSLNPTAENGNVRGDSQTGKGFNMHASLKTNTTVQWCIKHLILIQVF